MNRGSNTFEKCTYLILFYIIINRYSKIYLMSKQRSAHDNIHFALIEMLGLSPYEKRVIELLKTGNDKKAFKFAKKKLGNVQRAKKKRNMVSF